LSVGLLGGFTPLILMELSFILIIHEVSIILINRTFNLFDGVDYLTLFMVVDVGK